MGMMARKIIVVRAFVNSWLNVSGLTSSSSARARLRAHDERLYAAHHEQTNAVTP